MPRLLGVDIPSDKPTVISLTYLYGVGKKIARDLCHKAGIDPQVRARNLREDELARLAALLDKAGIPVVLLDRDLEAYPGRSRYDLVGIDNRRAGYAITAHLLKRGCQRLVFVGRPHSAPTVDARIAGFREALLDAGMDPRPAVIWRIDPAEAGDVKKLIDKVRPDGVVCANDFTAAHLMKSLGELGVNVPADVRLVGIDDVKYASLLPVPLTTIHQPCVDIGAAADQPHRIKYRQLTR